MWYRRNWHSKFGNVQETYNGRTFHSTLEARYAKHLDILKKSKDIQKYTCQPRFRLTVNGKKIGDIIPDFLVIGKHGREEIHEVKGKAEPLWQWKWKHLQAEYPDYKYILIRRGDF